MTTFETEAPSLSSILESYKHHQGMKIWIPKYGFHKYEKNGLFLRTLRNLVWISHPTTVIPFLLFDSCRKDKIRTNDPEISSIVYEIIRTNLKPVIFFLRKDFERKKNRLNAKQTIYSLLEVFARAKNCCPCCLVSAYFVLLACFGLICVFVHLKCFDKKKKKKKNRSKIALITSYTILLNYTPLNPPIKNCFSTNFSTNFLHRIYFYALIFICQDLFSSVKTYFHVCAISFNCANL